eukprot:TRINITY_DN697_c0_g3_i1.p2 TRINITY_DN697_c0_g3~~TRINITY_DN697_c0_g3_i1.p2  ORF type:complete len:486 (+),score=266.49 TRINITY_DN697_c0_g3_i1:74-1531(+)
MGKKLYVLFETAAGYGLFLKEEGEEIGAQDVKIQKSWQDYGLFKRVMSFVSFAPFRDSEQALEDINALSEGQVTQFLAGFLSNTLPSKKSGYEVGVSETKMGSAIQENLGISCVANEYVQELTRGIRVHAQKMIPPVKEGDLERAGLSLAHSYSRSKVKFNVHRSDNMIIQAIAIVEKLDKDINTFSMRLKEWYGWHFPELLKIVTDSGHFCRLTVLLKNKEDVTDSMLPQITEIVNDEEVAQQVLAMAKVSMGGAISAVDMVNIEAFAFRLARLMQLREEATEYLRMKLHAVSPNLASLMGDNIAAKLIAHAGSLTNLAKYPASTVQILGAEKALFRALKSKGNTPKYGIIFNTTFIGKAKGKNKGRISRYLANKASIASRIDAFGDVPTTVFGDKLRDQVDDRLVYYEERKHQPMTNVKAMEEALTVFKKELKKHSKKSAETEAAPEKTKKDKKRKAEAAVEEEDEPKKKKNKKEKKEKKSKA